MESYLRPFGRTDPRRESTRHAWRIDRDAYRIVPAAVRKDRSAVRIDPAAAGTRLDAVQTPTALVERGEQ
jgi:hypothetical protein